MATRSPDPGGIPAGPEPTTLTPLEESVLAFERTRWHRASAKDDAIRARLGISPGLYYATLSRLASSDTAMAYDPLLVQRLQRRIEERARWASEDAS